jgi:hypothetical protein
MYGVGYSHSNLLGGGYGWSFYVVNNGNVNSVLGAAYSYFAGSARSPIFYDSDNTAYYVNPDGTASANMRGYQYFADYGAGIVGTYSSYRYQLVWAIGDSYKGSLDGTSVAGGYGLWFSHPNAGGVAASLTSHGLMLIVNGSMYATVDASMRAITDMRAPIFYDYNDTSYYTNPNSTSVMSSIALGGAGSVPQGVLWASGEIWINGNGNRVAFTTDASTDSTPNASVRGSSNDLIVQNWSGSASNDNFWVYGAGRYTESALSSRAPIFYDSNDTSYYTNPNSDSSMYQIKVWGNQIIIRGGSPTLFFQDADENSAMLHNNSNLFYILRGGNDTTSWSQVGGYWPVYWNLGNNDATFGGAIWAAGNITAYSDAKLKENVETIDSALDKTLKLRGVYYTLIRDETKTRKLGVIAQEVQEVVPEVVMLHQDKEDEEGTLSVDYGNMVGLLIEAIKELSAEVEMLKAR